MGINYFTPQKYLSLQLFRIPNFFRRFKKAAFKHGQKVGQNLCPCLNGAKIFCFSISEYNFNERPHRDASCLKGRSFRRNSVLTKVEPINLSTSSQGCIFICPKCKIQSGIPIEKCRMQSAKSKVVFFL